MQSVEKEGMKLYDKLGKIKGDHAARLMISLEDCDRHGVYNIYLRVVFKRMTNHIDLKHMLEAMSKGTVFNNILYVKPRCGSHYHLPFAGQLGERWRHAVRHLEDEQVQEGGWQAWHIWCI